jgi:hypothetical protein
MIKKIARFVFETAYGPFVAWCCAMLLFFTAFIFSPMFGSLGTGIVVTMLIVQILVAIAGLIAFFISLNESKWVRAFGQFILGIMGLFLFSVGLVYAYVACRFVTYAISGAYGKVRSASITNETSKTEFTVEFRPAHPFLAEYDKCIVFPSGKRIGVWMDTGGAGVFAVYRLSTGEYYLVDGLENDFIRSDYRVNVTNETVEMMCGKLWIKIPDKTLSITAKSEDSLSVKMKEGEKVVAGGTPIGDSLKGRVFCGHIYSNGIFETGKVDLYFDFIESKIR